MLEWVLWLVNSNLSLHLGKTECIFFGQSELLGQFRLISDRASDVSGGRICLTQNACTLNYSSYGKLQKPFGDYEPIIIGK